MSTGAVVLHEGGNRVSLRAMPENIIDAVVTDPPYSLTSITKRFGKPGSAPARREKNDGGFARVSGGFMGKTWDASGIERDPEFWAEVYRVLKPGGFVFAFAGARTGHWQAVAMELAGFIMHPMHSWLYGQGFPKGHALDPALLGGGWKYGTQTQKPAMEPIYLGQKPYDGKPVESILKWGVGAFNIDGCRVPTTENLGGGAYAATSEGRGGTWQNDERAAGDGAGFRNGGAGDFSPPPGRYPANVLHDGSDAVVALFPETGVSSGGKGKASGQIDNDAVYGKFSGENPGVSAGGFGDSGSAARFFNSFPADDFPWPLAFYHGKAGKADRRADLVDRDAGEKPHPTVKPIGLLRHLVRHICPPGGTVLDPFGGTGTTAEAARLEGMNAVLMEAEPEYVAFLRRRFDLPDPLMEIFG